MPVCVVDALEVIYVEHDERDRVAHARGEIQIAFELHVEGAPIKAAGQRVG